MGRAKAGRAAGRARPPAARRDLRAGDEPASVELVEEQLAVTKREVEHGRVAVHVHVDEREELAEAVLRHEHLAVERVPVGRVVTERPPVREEDGVLVVPVLEERLVVRTELVLKEELRIVRESRNERFRQLVRLRAERAEVSRADPGADDQPDNLER
jgi:uncharacterized protein (TIGR02271 family)